MTWHVRHSLHLDRLVEINLMDAAAARQAQEEEEEEEEEESIFKADTANEEDSEREEKEGRRRMADQRQQTTSVCDARETDIESASTCCVISIQILLTNRVHTYANNPLPACTPPLNPAPKREMGDLRVREWFLKRRPGESV